MKKTLLFTRLIAIGLILLFSSGWALGQVTISSQGFEADLTGYSHTPSQTPVTDPGDQYFYRAEPSDAAIYEGSVGPYTNVTGSWLFVGSNPNTINGGSEGLLTLDGIDVSGYTDLEFHGDFGACPLDWDATDDLRIEYNFDGGAWSTLFSFAVDAGSDGTNEPLELSGNALGGINTADGTVLTYDLVTISSDNFTGSGSTLNIRLACNSGANYEAFGVDNILVKGVVSGTPTITLSETTLTDFSYDLGNGPSAEQSFTVEGADLTADITLTPPTNYEISTATGGSFVATNPITLTQSGGTVSSTTIYTRLKAGLAVADYNAEDITAASTDATNQTVTCSGSVYNQLDWANLQWPENGTIARGNSFSVYAQVYEAGVTDGPGQGTGITAWIGYSTSDTDPSTWTNWVAASYNTDSGNNDEYTADIGTAIAAPGVYYYASRFQQGSSPYYYGGYNSAGGGAWDGTTNVSGILTVTGAVSVVINEVDADTPGTEVDEFVELYDGGIGNTALDGLVLVLYNGSDDASYMAYDLDTYSTDADGYFVIGGSGVAEADYTVGSTYWVQNGADAVALFYGDDTAFPNDTPITTTDLIDAIVYDSNDGDDAALLVLLNASEPQVNEGAGGSLEGHSNQRFTNGTGGVRNTTTYIQATPTPGSKNLAETNWTGATDTDWATAGNWSNGIPTSDYNVNIPASLTNYPLVGASTTAGGNIIEIESGATLSVAGILTPNGNTGGIIINSDASTSGSLIVTGTLTSVTTKSSQIAPSSTITYKRYVTGGQWHLLSAPVNGQSINSMLGNADNDIELSGSDYSMKDYDESADNWNTLFTAATAGNMTSGKGYVLTRTTDGIVTMDGEYADAAYTTALTRAGQGWNLLGNPYPSAISANATADATNNLLTVNAGVLDPSYTALYIWDEATTSYLIINHAAGSPTGTLSQDYLQAGQGFFVRSVDPASGTFSMNTAMQSHQTGLAFKSEDASWPSITLNAETTSAKAYTQITYQNMMTKGLDIGYDAGLFNSNPDFALYSRLVEDNGVDFGLQALPEDYDNLIIPIGLDAKAGEIITFSAQSLNIPEDYAVVLEDRAMNIFTDLSDEAEYAVQLSGDSDGTGRFFVRTSMKSALGIGDLDTENAFQVFTRVNSNQLLIRGEATVNTQARIYSITGKQIATVNLEQATENYVPFNEEAGVYIVQISNEQGTYTQKFSWVK